MEHGDIDLLCSILWCLFVISLIVLVVAACCEGENPMPIGFKRESHHHPIIMVHRGRK